MNTGHRKHAMVEQIIVESRGWDVWLTFQNLEHRLAVETG